MDALTDVYALGCLLYESLTGRAAVRGIAGQNAMLAHVNEPPPSPPARRAPTSRASSTRSCTGDGQAGERALPLGRRPGQAAVLAAGGRRRQGAGSSVATGDADAVP